MAVCISLQSLPSWIMSSNMHSDIWEGIHEILDHKGLLCLWYFNSFPPNLSSFEWYFL